MASYLPCMKKKWRIFVLREDGYYKCLNDDSWISKRMAKNQLKQLKEKYYELNKCEFKIGYYDRRLKKVVFGEEKVFCPHCGKVLK